MPSIVVGLYDDNIHAQEVQQELINAGLTDQEIAIISQQAEQPSEPSPDIVDKLRASLGDEADFYLEGTRHGGTLVSVDAPDDRVDSVINIMQRHQPLVDIAPKSSEQKQNKWKYFRPGAQPQTTSPAPPHPDIAEIEFRHNFESHFANSGYTFDQIRPAYQYGQDWGLAPQFADRDWEELAPEIRQRFEERNPNRWDQFAPAILCGFQQARATPAPDNTDSSRPSGPTASGSQRATSAPDNTS